MEPSWPKIAKIRVRTPPLSDLKLNLFSKWRLGGLQARFWRPQGSILEPPGLDFGASSLDFEASRLDCGASRPPAFLWLRFPHSATQFDKCGTELLPWGSFLFCSCLSSKGLAKVWEAAVSPLGAFNGIIEDRVQLRILSCTQNYRRSSAAKDP